MAYAKIDQAGIYQGASCKTGTFGKQTARNFAAYTGMVCAFAGTAVPTGWLDCNGAAVSRTTYAALFAIISTTYGAGDGSTTFNIPDARGRMLIGVGTGAGLTARALADTGGAETVALIEANLGAHAHMENRYSTGSAAGQPAIGDDATLRAACTTDASGSGTAHQNMQPARALYWLIKT